MGFPVRHRTLTEELALSPLRVLLVSGDPGDLQLVSGLLQRGRVGHFLLESIDHSDRALARMIRNANDVCLLTHHLEPESGLALLEHAMAAGCELPVVMISATPDYDLDMAAMQRGAADYLPREELNEVTLERTIRYAIKHNELQRELRQLAVLDPLTGLCNRRGFADRLRRGMARAERASSRLALLVLDLDGFKGINDAFGHQVGDEVLCQVARRLTETVRKTDTVCRIGGDEFAIILEGISTRDDATRVAEAIVASLGEPFAKTGRHARAGGSVGLCLFPDDGDSADRLLQLADGAMYRAKRSGGARHAEHGDWPREYVGP